jgi:hypothetical protein
VTKEQLADLAIDMQRQRRKIETWMRTEGYGGRLVQAGQHPEYQDYERACTVFQVALHEYVEAEVAA